MRAQLGEAHLIVKKVTHEKLVLVKKLREVASENKQLRSEHNVN